MTQAGLAGRLMRTALLATFVLEGCAPAKARTFPAHARHEIVIRAMRFEPARLEAQVGDTLCWRNQDLVPHTASAASGAFDSGAIAPDSSWTWVADTNGSLAYACRFHPTMSASCLVRS